MLSSSVLEGETDFDEAVLDVESAKEQAEWLIDNAAYANLEGEDEYKLSDYQAHFKAEYEKDQFNLRYYQNYFLYKLQVQVEQGKPVSKEDLHYAEKTRDYIELIHESFRETSMLKDYSDFIESVRG
ncbi:hypothetical protein N9R64_00885 [Emcibacteraceae bacterium]|nr:hypothetical protein [Emcibacteraceae bacterium]